MRSLYDWCNMRVVEIEPGVGHVDADEVAGVITHGPDQLCPSGSVEIIFRGNGPTMRLMVSDPQAVMARIFTPVGSRPAYTFKHIDVLSQNEIAVKPNGEIIGSWVEAALFCLMQNCVVTFHRADLESKTISPWQIVTAASGYKPNRALDVSGSSVGPSASLPL